MFFEILNGSTMPKKVTFQLNRLKFISVVRLSYVVECLKNGVLTLKYLIPCQSEFEFRHLVS